MYSQLQLIFVLLCWIPQFLCTDNSTNQHKYIERPLVTAIIDLEAFAHNLERVRSFVPDSKVMAMIKGNGYGHGLELAAKALQNADSFGVARLDEALRFRSVFPNQTVTIMNTFASDEELKRISYYRIDIIIHTIELADLLECVRLENPIRVWLKLDTGLNRLGINLTTAESVYKRLEQNPNVIKPVGLLTHFARANELDHNETELQIQRFNTFASGKVGPQSLANSAGIQKWPKSRRSWVRPGTMLYGLSSFANITSEQLKLKPVMTLKSKLISVRRVNAGKPVGYGGQWRSDRDTYLGVVAIGYGDGYRLDAPNGTPLLVNGRRVPLVGKVSMDLLTVDLGPELKDKVGDEVIVWGQGLPIDEVAQHIGIPPHKMTTSLTGRVVRKLNHEAV